MASVPTLPTVAENLVPVCSASDVLRAMVELRPKLDAFSVRRIGLFGSAAREQLQSDSDLDFLVDLDNESFRNVMGLKLLLEDHLGRKVDLVLARNLKPRIRDRVLAETRYVEGY